MGEKGGKEGESKGDRGGEEDSNSIKVNKMEREREIRGEELQV